MRRWHSTAAVPQEWNRCLEYRSSSWTRQWRRAGAIGATAGAVDDITYLFRPVDWGESQEKETIENEGGGVATLIGIRLFWREGRGYIACW